MYLYSFDYLLLYKITTSKIVEWDIWKWKFSWNVNNGWMYKWDNSSGKGPVKIFDKRRYIFWMIGADYNYNARWMLIYHTGNNSFFLLNSSRKCSTHKIFLRSTLLIWMNLTFDYDLKWQSFLNIFPPSVHDNQLCTNADGRKMVCFSHFYRSWRLITNFTIFGKP